MLVGCEHVRINETFISETTYAGILKKDGIDNILSYFKENKFLEVVCDPKEVLVKCFNICHKVPSVVSWMYREKCSLTKASVFYSNNKLIIKLKKDGKTNYGKTMFQYKLELEEKFKIREFKVINNGL